MAYRIEFHCWNRWRGIASRFVFLPVLLGVALVVAAGAQKAPKPTPPKYDLQTETKIKGTIQEIKMPPKGSEKEIAHLLLKAGADTLDVYLCPKSFFDDMGMTFAAGDEITLTGSKIKQGDADLVLAREVVKGNDTYVLRDAKGNPVWY
jgi:hypothetical protein